MDSKNNFKREKAVQLSDYRMFVKFKPEYAAEHRAYNGDIKYYHSFNTKLGDGMKELVDMLYDRKETKFIGHYLFAWIYDNHIQDSDVLRAWDKFGNELSLQELSKLNNRLKAKRKNK